MKYKGTKHPRGIELDRAGGAAVLLRHPQDHRQAARARRGGHGISAARTIGDHTLGRRGAENEAGGASGYKRTLAAKPHPEDDPERAEERARFNSRPLYIFDEPTTGLHFDDVSKLLAAFRRLIEAGGSVLVIEHDLDVIKTADWVIDMGPEGGSRGRQDRRRGHARADRRDRGFLYGSSDWRASYQESTALRRTGARRTIAGSRKLLQPKTSPPVRI